MHLGRTLARSAYWKRGKAEKGLLGAYLQRTTVFSRAQTARLIKTNIAERQMADGRKGLAQPFHTRHTRADILLLAEIDALRGALSRPATMALLQCAFEVFRDARYERLAGICNGHLYDLRRSRTYARVLGAKDATRPTLAPLGALP